MSARFGTFVGLLATVLLPAACTCGTGPYEGEYFDGDRPDPITKVKFVESEKGDPRIIGCADGQREGFADLKKAPRIAGCMGTWDSSKSLADPPTGKPCGDDGDKCAVPADVCAPGWHVCGSNGNPRDLRDRATADMCHNAGPGRFNAGMSHSPTDEIDPCPTITASTKLPCVQAGLGSEPVCCGNDCLYGACKDGVWKDKTKISRGTSEGCGAVTSERNGGVLCCYDGKGNPADEIGAAEGKAGEGKADAKAEGGKADGKAAAGGKLDASGKPAKGADGATPKTGAPADSTKPPAAGKADPTKADAKKK